MVEQPVGNGFEDAAVGKCIVEGGDLGEGFGVVGGNPFQLAAVLECARHRGQPRAAPVVNLLELVAQSVVGDVVGVERRHVALDRDDVVARVGVGVRGVGGGDVLLDAAVAPVDGGVDGLVERQIGLQARRGDVDSEDEGVEVQTGLGDGDDLFGLVLFAVAGRYGDGCGAGRSARIGLCGDCKSLLGFRGGEPVGIFGKRVLPVVVGSDSQLFFVGFGGSGREWNGF